MKSFLLAVQFLTSIPVSVKDQVSEKDFKYSLYYYAIVGGIIGCFLGVIGHAVYFLSSRIAAVVIVCLGVIITGGLHIDGFADSCDGLYGHKSKEDRLRIMRDSRNGAMGVMGIVCLLLIKYVLVSSLPHVLILPTLLCVGVFSRFSMIFAGYNSKYVRDEGKAKFFFDGIGKKAFWTNIVFVIVAFAFFFQLSGILIFCVSTFVIYLAIKFIERKINGMTGDTVGAINEIAEICVLFGVYVSTTFYTYLSSF